MQDREKRIGIMGSGSRGRFVCNQPSVEEEKEAEKPASLILFILISTRAKEGVQL